ncbi:hypothetical protein DMENIID0001_044970 [Sergentomyia squamirostris]
MNINGRRWNVDHQSINEATSTPSSRWTNALVLPTDGAIESLLTRSKNCLEDHRKRKESPISPCVGLSLPLTMAGHKVEARELEHNKISTMLKYVQWNEDGSKKSTCHSSL